MRHDGGQVSCERRYFITTLVGDVRAFANAVCAHWGIENCLHLGTRGHVPGRLSVVSDSPTLRSISIPYRQFALNLLMRAYPSRSIKQKELSAAWDDAFRAIVVFHQ